MKNLDEDLKKINHLFNSEKYTEIIQFAEKNLERYKNNFQFINTLGLSYFHVKQIKNAFICFNSLLKINNNPLEKFILAESFLTIRANDKAKILLINIINEPSIDNEIKSKINMYLGNIYYNLQKFEEAINFFSKSITINKNNIDAYNDLALTHYFNKDLSKSKKILDQALTIEPLNPKIFNTLASIYIMDENYDEAEKKLEKLIKKNKGNADSFCNLALIKIRKNDFQKSYEYLIESLKKDSNHRQALMNFTIIINFIVIDKKDYQQICRIIIEIIDKKYFYRSGDLMPIIKKLLNFDNNFLFLKKNCNYMNSNQIIEKIYEIPLFLKALELQHPIPDLEIEKFLKILRLKILHDKDLLLINFDTFNLLNCLSAYFFQIEYVVSININEAKEVIKLKEKLNEIDTYDQSTLISLYIFGMYQKISDLSNFQRFIIYKSNPLIKSHILDFIEENSIKSKLKSLSEIQNNTSAIVQNQYEENPYPRWSHFNLTIQSKSVEEVFRTLNLKYNTEISINFDFPNILIAGCGTGQHAISSKMRFKNSKLICIDLSKSSLAYAQRKVKELKLDNIEFFQCDILNIDQLSQENFDIIESVGVIHHMEDPEIGLKNLAQKVKIGGFIKIGLYSQLARDSINIYRKKYAAKDYLTKEKLIQFREKIIFENITPELFEISDFYSLSEFRDLMCHVQEHQFNLIQIDKLLKKNNLRFIGFEITNQIVLETFINEFGSNNLYNLNKWNEFEIRYPKSFIGMYQFWCQKI